MKMEMKRAVGAFVLALSMIGTTGCAQRDQLQPNQSNVWMVSERREIAIGEQVSKEVEREYSVYQDADLAAYVDQVGQSLARNSDRPNISYHFKVLDSPIANAFATPGGFIYVTRGMLGVLDDEAEMAGVIGHEIGHVAARHSAKQIQNSTLTSIGMIAVGIALGDKLNDDMLTAANAAATLIFLGYSRGDEDQADILGAKYLHRTGYDPEAMIGVMEGLLELDNRNPMKAEQFLMSHPLTRERVKHLQTWLPRIAQEDVWGGTPPGTKLRGRETFQRIAAAQAVYPGGEEMQSLIENYRIALVRSQREMAAKALDDNYRDEKGRSKGDYLAMLDQLFASAKRINYKVAKIETEPRRTGGAAKYDYILEVTDRNTGQKRTETGRAYMEFVRPEPQIWKISSIRVLAAG